MCWKVHTGEKILPQQKAQKKKQKKKKPQT